ncbi:LEAF RUST 10 DISEASE-RESISTANCE LOCUS RECEPTOR-LIKE PROTEIN KINASE-like 2.2 [Eucalyptus grandis]|uniref:LEAF RUST 10 DISEASE-RESISTANCE LOCUS RECEPTOR-LIKE PROTEIN KINASE-like 2.2 n=1 Tax=Eucalyptus grandis TaxID=71139 RepID=UPI00192EE628|nr:LEAF RUST 10 DISEASE-RESISTANCE LOCUS RECEPTOR-LIKE PROTEIN KINASE-like 2.2 [Eucalyptus grandis]
MFYVFSGVATLGAGIGIALILMLSFQKKPMIRRIMALIKQRSEYFDGEKKIEGLISSRRYIDKDIKRITNSFKEKLGQGGYGCVYKGKLQDGQLVAVKLLKKLKGDAEEFFNEVASINRTSHVNVGNLLGFCFEGSKRSLGYEFMPNGSLEKFIFNRSNIIGVRSTIELGHIVPDFPWHSSWARVLAYMMQHEDVAI